MEDFIKYGSKKPFVRRKKQTDEVPLNEFFQHPIIHREIHGEQIFVPLDLQRIWLDV